MNLGTAAPSLRRTPQRDDTDSQPPRVVEIKRSRQPSQIVRTAQTDTYRIVMPDGRSVIIDAAARDRVVNAAWRWLVVKNRSMWTEYVVTSGVDVSNGDPVLVYLHRWVVGATSAQTVKIGKGNRSDYRRSNLTVYPDEQKLAEFRRRHPFTRRGRPASQYPGVIRREGKWVAKWVDPDTSEKVYLGPYDTEIQAHQSRTATADAWLKSRAQRQVTTGRIVLWDDLAPTDMASVP